MFRGGGGSDTDEVARPRSFGVSAREGRQAVILLLSIRRLDAVIEN